MMEAVILIGIQGSGKSTFYRERFFSTHIRINLDMLKTRNREQHLLNTCIADKQSFVVDNTNPTRENRSRYIKPAKVVGFKIIGYYFQPQIESCQQRNEQRPEPQVVPLKGLLGTYSRLEVPCLDEGFDELFSVQVGTDGGFIVEEWKYEL
jgi:predicted kinase